MLRVEDWAEIRRLHFTEGLPIRTIAKRLHVHRDTVRSAVRSASPPVYERPAAPSKLDPYKEDIGKLLKGWPEMPATVMAERTGYGGGLSILRDYLREVRPLYREPDPIQRTTYAPGELAQWDFWFPAVDIPVGFDHTARLPVWVGVSGYSRMATGLMVPSRSVHDLIAAHLHGLKDLGGVPRAGIYDNEKAIVASRKGGVIRFSAEFLAFSGALCFKPVPLRPAFPQGKGLVERFNRYLETSFLPGRTFESVEDFNRQLAAFFDRANHREHRELRCRPVDRIAEDRGAMLPLPPVLPEVARRFAIRLGRDWHVRVGTCDYSVHPKAIGRVVDVDVTLSEVVVRCKGEELARHPRSLSPHRTITQATHGRAHRELKGPARANPEVTVEERDLASYDAAFGVFPAREVDPDVDRRSENGSWGLQEPRLAEVAAG